MSRSFVPFCYKTVSRLNFSALFIIDEENQMSLNLVLIMSLINTTSARVTQNKMNKLHRNELFMKWKYLVVKFLVMRTYLYILSITAHSNNRA